MQNSKTLINNWKLLIIVIFLFLSFAHSSELWKISLHTGGNISCSEIYKLTNDSLYTKILGENKNFAINDISNITSFKKNVNIGLICGSVAGGVLGSLASSKENSETGSMIGAMGGALLAHFFNYNKSISLSKMSINEKHYVLEKLVSN